MHRSLKQVAGFTANAQPETAVKKTFSAVAFCFLLAASSASPASAQTFELGGGSDQPATAPAPGAGRRKAAPEVSPGGQIGWGSSIEVGRMARAASDALKRGQPSAAADFAARAVKAAPQDAKLWFLLGYTSRLAGRLDQSLQAYQEGLKRQPGSPDGLSGMAQTYARMGNTDEAKKLLLQVINSNPRRENDLLLAGELFIRSKQTQEGINLLSRAEAIHPSAHAEVMLAVAYMNLKQPQRARELLDMAKQRDPRNPSVFRAVANYYREQHDYSSAISTLKSSPVFNSDVLADLAYTYELKGDKQEAADAYSRAARLSPGQIGLQLSAASAYLRAGDPAKARDYLGRAEQLDPNHYRLHALRAQLARSEGRNDVAITEYGAAIAALPPGVPPEGQLYPILLRLNLAELYTASGATASAQREIAAAEQMVSQLQIEGTGRAEFLRVHASIETAGQDYKSAESDLLEAGKLDPDNLNINLQYAALLWKMDRKKESGAAYAEVLRRDPKNRLAMEGLGYLARDVGDNKTAERYFSMYAQYYPDEYAPYLELGDLYTAARDFTKAQLNYQKAHKLAPNNAVIIANGANAAIEARQIPLAGQWLARASGKTLDDPRVMRERERYLFHTGKYQESAQLGYKVLRQLPKDRNASVYLVYDLYNLGRFDEVFSLAARYQSILPREANFPLMMGHIRKQSGLLAEAAGDYSRALERDPRMVDAMINRGYVRNDMQDATGAAHDFEAALKLAPNNGVAHLGFAFSQLQLRHGKLALQQVELAEKQLGESGATHLVRATAFRQQRLMGQAEAEYRLALKFAPDDLKLHLALADTQDRARHYNDAIQTLNAALRLSPDDPIIYASLAHAYAHLHDRERTLRYVAAAEKLGPNESAILLNTGDALLTLGDSRGAMDRFFRAMQAPDGNRVEARLAMARLFEREGKKEDARQQIALAFAESRIGEAAPVTADNLVEAANVLLAMNDFDLAAKYFQHAKAAGAADEVVALGIANTFLAQGDARQAQGALASLSNLDALKDNYDYALTLGNIYRQQHETSRAVFAFARANELGGGDEIAQRAMQETAGQMGMPINDKVSVSSDFDMHALVDDQSIFNLDRQALGAGPGQLPSPRSSLESVWTNSFRVRQPGMPLISGFFQVRNARGQFAFPNESLVFNRDTYDTNFNGALNPVLHLGRNTFAFNTGLQFTIRRDKEQPVQMNQDLIRQFVFFSSNSMGNWLAMQGSAFHEAGPFDLQNLSSSEKGARVQFAVGRPWGHTRLLTGYSVRDLQFSPVGKEFFSTVASGGLQHDFGKKLKVAVLADYIRAWRSEPASLAAGPNFFIAQALRPATEVHYKVNNRWSVDGDFVFSRGQGFHAYDNVQNSFFISYTKPFRRSMEDGNGTVPVEYPIRLSFGIETADYFNFTGNGHTVVLPLVRLTVF
jgi:tetratricopeptide (TPR) repeat protein